MTQVNQDSRSPLKIVAIVAAVLAVILLVSAGFRIKSYSEGYANDYDARSYIYVAENGRFGDLYDTTLRDMDKKTQYSAEVEECRALAFYYEQAVLEHAYRVAGDSKKADGFAARMKEYEEQLGSMASRAEAVRKSVSG